MIFKKLRNPVGVSWLDPIFETRNISMKIVLIWRKKRKKRNRKRFNLQLLVICATLQNILKSRQVKVTWQVNRNQASKFKILFSTQNHKVCCKSRNKTSTLIRKSFVKKTMFKFPTMSCSFETNSAICTHPESWCMFCIIYSDTGL